MQTKKLRSLFTFPSTHPRIRGSHPDTVPLAGICFPGIQVSDIQVSEVANTRVGRHVHDYNIGLRRARGEEIKERFPFMPLLPCLAYTGICICRMLRPKSENWATDVKWALVCILQISLTGQRWVEKSRDPKGPLRWGEKGYKIAPIVGFNGKPWITVA